MHTAHGPGAAQRMRRVAPPSSRSTSDDVEELEEPFPNLRAGRTETPRVPELDPESCDLLGIGPHEATEPVLWVCEALACLLKQGQTIEITSFGIFKFRPWRPARPRQLGRQSPIETPYPGPVEFVPSATLLRQLEREMLDSSQMVRCDALFNQLRDDARLPKGKGPVVIRLVFRTLTEVLMEHAQAPLPGVGLLIQVRRPLELKVDVRAWEVRSKSPRPHVHFCPTPALLEGLPGLAHVREEVVLPVAPEEIRVQVPTEKHEDLPPGMTLRRAAGEPPRSPSALDGVPEHSLDADEAELAPTSQNVVPTFLAEEDDLLPPPRDEDIGAETGRILARRAAPVPAPSVSAASEPAPSVSAPSVSAASVSAASVSAASVSAVSGPASPPQVSPVTPETDEDDGGLL